MTEQQMAEAVQQAIAPKSKCAICRKLFSPNESVWRFTCSQNCHDSYMDIVSR